jgi:hypothetical protein
MPYVDDCSMHMSKLDVWCKRFLQIAVAFSLILISISVFLYSSTVLTAAPPKSLPYEPIPQIVGLGCDNRFVYYMEIVPNTLGSYYQYTYKREKKGAKIRNY